MVFPTAGEDQPRSPAYHADQQPPGIAQSCDQSTLCLQTTAGPNLAQIFFPRQRKGLPSGAADPAPGWVPGPAMSSTSTSKRVMRPRRAPAAHWRSRGHTAAPRPGAARGLPALGMAGWPEREGTQPGGEAAGLNPGCENPASRASGTSVPTLSRINLLGRVECALFLLDMQIISLNNLTANIFWFLTPCPGQKQAVFSADPLASFATLGLDCFDFTEARETYELLG